MAGFMEATTSWSLCDGAIVSSGEERGGAFITALYDGAERSRVLFVVSLPCAWANGMCSKDVRSSKPARSLFCKQTTTYIGNMGNDTMNHSD